ncbi:MAG: hypothetical protein K8R59_02935 [Thermoanaerobaculales bacterium]|nr:hypothetical protein [Thermoanaerobaculales bacterium]
MRVDGTLFDSIRDVAEGRDPQLEMAIKLVLEELETAPPTTPERSPYPIRVRR